MSRDTDWHVFDKAVEITASAVRGTMSGDKAPALVAGVFKEVYAELRRTMEEMPSPENRPGF